MLHVKSEMETKRTELAALRLEIKNIEQNIDSLKTLTEASVTKLELDHKVVILLA